MCGRVFIFFVLVSQVFCRRQLPDCQLNIANTEDEGNMPLLLYNYTKHFEEIVPQQGMVRLKHGDSIILACPGKGNYLTPTNSNVTHATCITGSTLKVNRRNLRFTELECEKAIRGDVKNINKKCANGSGYISEIGYQITRITWVNLIRECYNNDTGQTYYTEHVLHGKEIKHSSSFTDRPTFSTKGVRSNIVSHTVNAYTNAHQNVMFTKLLGSKQLADRYINRKSYLARGHLSPAGDFLVTSSKRSSYFYINVCPQWQAINGGNWKSVENHIRKAAESYIHTFTIITGTYGVLSLSDVNNNLQEIYLLPENTLPIPKLIWKILYDKGTRLGIAIMVINNPFLTEVSYDDLICENICEQYGWGSRNWSKISKGFVYCCDLNEFLKVVHAAPRMIVEGVLSPIK